MILGMPFIIAFASDFECRLIKIGEFENKKERKFN